MSTYIMCSWCGSQQDVETESSDDTTVITLPRGWVLAASFVLCEKCDEELE
jgi:hypothetical protein